MKNLPQQLTAYLAHLMQEERSSATVMQYKREIQTFLDWIGSQALTKDAVVHYKQLLQEQYKTASVNAKLTALNGFFGYLGQPELKVKQLRIQRQAYCTKDKELTKAEYLRLVKTAQAQRNARLAMLLQTICGTGIRVSELQFITVEAVNAGEATIQLKGKTRTILIAGKLRKSLLRYIRDEGLNSGPVFVSKSGRPLDRSNIWKMMKQLCRSANVDEKKVFPHNLRHLFARMFYAIDKDIAKLADILGHSSIDTTRIYIVSSGIEHRRRMDALGLVI